MNVLNKLAEFVGKNLTYIVVAVVVAAFFQPQAFTWAASKTVLLLSVIMFGMGMTLRASDFALHLCSSVPKMCSLAASASSQSCRHLLMCLPLRLSFRPNLPSA